MATPNKQNNNIRISLIISCLILIGLLVSKFTGYDSLFSYKAPTPSTKQYHSGIALINTFLNAPDQSNSLFAEGKKYISESLTNLKDRQLLQYISGDIKKIGAVETYKETKECLDLFITGITLLEDIKKNFQIVSENTIKLEITIKQRVLNLPSSNTKQCLEGYIKSLYTSKESLSLTYDNITNIESLYYKSLSGYKDEGGGLCSGIKEFTSSAKKLEQSIIEVIRTTELVQKLDSFDIQEYNTLCKYGGIQGIENIQKESWLSRNYLDSFVINLKKTNNIKDYIQEILPSAGSGSLVNINNLK